MQKIGDVDGEKIEIRGKEEKKKVERVGEKRAECREEREMMNT